MLDNMQPPATVAATVDAQAFAHALKMAGYVIEAKNSIPVLRMVKIDAVPDSVVVTATDLDIQLTQVVPADCADTGAVVVAPQGVAAQIGKAKGAASVAFDGQEVVFMAGGSTSVFATDTPVTDFPNMRGMDGAFSQVAMESADLLRALKRVLPSVSTELTRCYLNGILMHGPADYAGAPSGLRMVSTDGHRLARYDAKIMGGDVGAAWKAGPAILPTKTAQVLAKLLAADKVPGAVQIYANAGKYCTQLIFASARWVLQTKVIDGTFPDYSRVIPVRSKDSVCTIDPASLPKLPKYENTLALDFDAGQMWWHMDGGKGSKGLLCEGAGVFGFNVNYLADLGRACDGDILTVFVSGDVSSGANCSGLDPALIRCNDTAFLGVVMPKRI